MRYDVEIDGVSILSTYGAFIAKGGFNEIVRWPSLKEVKVNDWQEYDGLEPDLSTMRVAGCEASVNYICRGGIEALDAFWNFLKGKPVREYEFAGLGLATRMRVVAMSDLNYARAFSVIAVRYAIDAPFADYEYQEPVSGLVCPSDYELNGVNLADYGIIILKGTAQETAKKGQIKPLLIRDISSLDGLTYDENPLVNDPDDLLGEGYELVTEEYEGVAGLWKRSKETGMVTSEGRDITLSCAMNAPVSTFWRNYLALLHDLTYEDQGESDKTLKGARTLDCQETGKEFKCWYRSQSVREFVLQADGNVWIKFDLTLSAFKESDIEIERFLVVKFGSTAIKYGNKVLGYRQITT